MQYEPVPHRRTKPCFTHRVPALALLGCVLLAGCGGGDGSAGGSPPTYTIRASITGLTTSGLSLALNGSTFPVDANSTSFIFPTQLATGSTYAVTIQQQPTDEFCSVSDGSGTIGTTSVLVVLTCGLTLVHSFGSNPSDTIPASIIRGIDGNFYGVAQTGGANGEYVKKILLETPVFVFVPNAAGTLERIAPTGAVTILWNFGNDSTDGLNPSSVIEGRDGNFFGTTWGGGLYGAGGKHLGGTVFQLSPTGMETVLWSFGNDPTRSWGPTSLIQATDGNLYGVTPVGGISRNLGDGESEWSGSVFKLTPQGVMTELWNFSADGDGAGPTTLIQGADGNLYGTTNFGGTYAVGGGADTCGTVFKIALDGTETVLWSFSVTDGCDPNALVQGTDGNFYGTTHSALGTVFRLSSTGVLTTLWSFGRDGAAGYYPTGLIEGTDGNFYGTTDAGGAYCDQRGCSVARGGTLFRITPTGILTVLWSFGNGNDGNSPHGLIEGTDGRLYGITADGGAYGAGSLFRF